MKRTESPRKFDWPDLPPPAIASLVLDSRLDLEIATAVGAVGGIHRATGNPQELVSVVGRFYPVLVLVERSPGVDWFDAVRAIKMRAATRQTPIVLLDPATEPGSAGTGNRDVSEADEDTLTSIDRVWPLPLTGKELMDRIAFFVSPPTRYPVGWNEPMSDAARKGVEEFNRGDYFEQHEYFEEAWNEEQRPIRDLYQGILQVGVAFLQIERGNWAGSLKLFRRGLPRLRDLPPICRGIDLAGFRSAAEAIHAEVTALGAARLGEYDLRRFPQLTLIDSDSADNR